MHCCVLHIFCIQGTVLDSVSCRPLSYFAISAMNVVGIDIWQESFQLKVACRYLVPRLVKSGKRPPPPGPIFWKKRGNEPFENVFMRTSPIFGALNPKNMPTESKKLLFGYVLSKVVCR